MKCEHGPFQITDVLIHLLHLREKYAFQIIFDLFYRPFVFFASDLLHDVRLAEEIAVQSFLVLIRDSLSIKSSSELKKWLFDTITEKCICQLEVDQSSKISEERDFNISAETARAKAFILNSMLTDKEMKARQGRVFCYVCIDKNNLFLKSV